MKARTTKKKSETALVLRTCAADGTSYNDFKWPLKVGAVVKCPDWKPHKNCGNGLHGLLYGAGDGGLLNWSPDAKWLVLKVKLSDVVMLGGKCKFPEAKIIFIGDRKAATDYLQPLVDAPQNIVGAFIAVGDDLIATAGYRGTATAGYSGTATAGYGGTATAGYRGTATAGYGGTATAGDRGTATAGDSGTATAGYSGTATAGDRGTATAGDSGEIRIRWYDYAKDRYRTEIAYVGENGIKPHIRYVLNDKHEFVEAS